ncbi:alpha/beta fold hydrolase, partial [Rhizobium hidalgonense]
MPTQRHWIDAGHDVRIFAETWGNENNPPIVLVHGYPDSHTVWESIATQLADQFYVIAYDVRGAGKSSVPTGLNAYKIAVLAHDLQAVVNTLLP